MRHAAHSRFVNFLGVRPWTLETLYLRAREAADKYARSRAAAFLAEESAKLAKAAQEYLLEQASLLNQFGNDLSGHIAHFSELERNLVDFGRTYSTVRLYSEENFKSFYLLGFDEAAKKHQPVNAAREHETFLDRQIGPTKKTLDLIEKTKEKGGDWLRGRLRIFATDRFRKDFESCRQEPDKHRDCGRFVEVLKHTRLNDGRKEKYEQFVYGALPMLRRSKRFPGSKGGEIRSVYLGVPATEGDPYSDFIQTVKDLLAAKGYTLKPTDLMLTDDPTCVYLFVEAHAFPLPVAPLIVEECHETYYNFYDAIGQERKQGTSAIPLHASRIWEGEFDDLKPMEERAAGPAFQALEILSLGPLLGVVGLQTVDDRVVFIYKDWRAAYPVDVRLGNKRQAKETLTRDNRLREKLLKHLAAREASAMGAAAAVVGPAALASASGTGVGVGVETGWLYFWALVYLNLALFPEGTPEYSIVQRRLTALSKQYRADLTGIGDQERKAHCRTQLGGQATWVGGYPVLSGFAAVHVGQDDGLSP
jgi:hypothetical protein